jgi:hypothetical protein
MIIKHISDKIDKIKNNEDTVEQEGLNMLSEFNKYCDEIKKLEMPAALKILDGLNRELEELKILMGKRGEGRTKDRTKEFDMLVDKKYFVAEYLRSIAPIIEDDF